MNLVLVVGERPEQANALAERLGILGVEAIPCARDWKLAVRSLMTHDVSMVLLDVDASEDSVTFFEILNEVSDVPIIARGVLANTDNVVSYLEAGAADFVGRATAPTVLAAKIQSLLRSVHSNGNVPDSVQIGEVSIDRRSRTVKKGAAEISLTPLEYRLLNELASNKGRPCRHGDLLKSVWGDDFVNCSHYLRLYVGYLRQKLEDNPRRPRMLLTEWGYGYRLVEPRATGKRARTRASLRLASPG